jgi:hypothetical protein
MDFSFSDKNSSCVLILSADDENSAIKELTEKVKHPEMWRMEILEFVDDHTNDEDNEIDEDLV